MANPLCQRCKKPLSKSRIAANKRKCYRCEVAVRREGKKRAHDRAVESEDFTAADYWALYEAQDGHCVVHNCRAQGKSRHLAVEHDHSCEMGHDKNRWCRACVRGLACVTHNEWIGRAGDDPEVFDSLAAYLRKPPARKILMEKMIVGTAAQTVLTLMQDYRVPRQRALKWLELARGVGPCPRQLNGSTITIRYIRIPRTTKQLFEIVETAPRIDAAAAVAQLTSEHGFTIDKAKKVLNSAWQRGQCSISEHGAVHYHGRGSNDSYIYSIEDGWEIDR